MVAFEMACQLRSKGEEVALVVLLDPDPVNPHPDPRAAGANAPSPPSSTAAFRKKIHRHLRELAPLGARDRLNYAAVRVKNRLNELQGNAIWSGRKFFCDAFDYPMPPALRSRNLTAVYQPAARLYKPQFYGGRVTLFKTKAQYRDDQLGWGKHIAEKLEIEELDTDHNSVFAEPFVQIFAERLKARIAGAANYEHQPSPTTVD